MHTRHSLARIRPQRSMVHPILITLRQIKRSLYSIRIPMALKGLIPDIRSSINHHTSNTAGFTPIVDLRVRRPSSQRTIGVIIKFHSSRRMHVARLPGHHHRSIQLARDNARIVTSPERVLITLQHLVAVVVATPHSQTWQVTPAELVPGVHRRSLRRQVLLLRHLVPTFGKIPPRPLLRKSLPVPQHQPRHVAPRLRLRHKRLPSPRPSLWRGRCGLLLYLKATLPLAKSACQGTIVILLPCLSPAPVLPCFAVVDSRAASNALCLSTPLRLCVKKTTEVA